uniref:Chromosome condensation (RCC1 homologue) protein, putative n=1 Tax=Theileria annulata TaxID=5874 RepID=A0A3B0MT90_THEAN
MDVYEFKDEAKAIPILPQLISLGINHSLCVSRTNTFTNSSRSRKRNDEVKQTTSYLNVLSWGKVPFNCLGQGVEVNTSEFPRVIPFFSGRRVTQVSCGDYHSAVLVCSSRENMNAGTVFTFGLGNSGRLGYHIDTNSEILSQQIGTDDKDEPSWCTPVPQPVGMSIGLRNNVVTISCGSNHTLVTTVDGCMYSWGVGAYGVLGNGSVANRYIPVKVIFPYDDIFISKCAAGSRHSMALDRQGNVWSWGYGGNGRLGLGNTRSYFTPNLIEIFDTYEVFQISCGDSHSACLDRFGTVYTWGSCRGGKLGLGNILSDVLEPTVVESLKGIHIIQVSCGTGNTLALSSTGKIYQWGSTLGFNKQTDGLISHTVYLPQPVVETGFKNIFVTSGPYSFAAINIFGDLLTWGLGTGYRLGHGDSKDHVIPKFVSYLRTRMYIDNLLKTYDEAAFKVEDTVEKDSINPYDERRIQQIAVGDSHGALLTCNGTVYTWGVNNGTGYNSSSEPLENYCEPILFNHFSSKITKIACGSSHTLAVTINGLLFSWGSNENGQLGHGDLRSRVVPDSVNTIENCINVFAGIDNSGCICSVSHENMMKDEYGTLWVFGSSTCGKLGLGENMTSTVMTPREITTITGVHSLALGAMHSLALTHDGTLYASGAGSGGRLGTGDTTNAFVFVQVKTDHKFVAIAAGSSHSLAISMENDLYGWGEGKYLTLDEDFVLEPTIINTIPSSTGQAKIVAVAVAANHSLVLSQTGNVFYISI